MKLTYLGDALDHWKGSLFAFLQSRGLLQNFAVDPMATDLEAWKEDDFQLLASLLRIRREQIIPHRLNVRQV